MAVTETMCLLLRVYPHTQAVGYHSVAIDSEVQYYMAIDSEVQYYMAIDSEVQYYMAMDTQSPVLYYQWLRGLY